MAMVEIENVHKFFGDLHVLKGASLSVEQGEVCAILGPSGSGKSTLLRCVNVLEEIQAGSITVDGTLMGFSRDSSGGLHELTTKQLAAQRTNIGMVFQRFNLFPHMTALQNVMEAPIQVKGLAKADAAAKAKDLLDRVGLSDRAEHYPAQLSGGQQQRVAIARALAMEPDVMLFDEPTSAGTHRIRTPYVRQSVQHVQQQTITHQTTRQTTGWNPAYQRTTMPLLRNLQDSSWRFAVWP